MNIIRYMIVEFSDGSKTLLREGGIQKLYDGFKLPLPDITKPVISMELRRAISELGFVLVLEDTDDEGSVMFVPPSGVRNMKFYIFSKDKYDEKKCESIMRDHLNGWNKNSLNLTPETGN
jgi:hypothetical protein